MSVCKITQKSQFVFPDPFEFDGMFAEPSLVNIQVQNSVYANVTESDSELTGIKSSAPYNLYASCFLRQEINSELDSTGQLNRLATSSASNFGLPGGASAQAHEAVPLWEIVRWNKPVNQCIIIAF
jgi:hypothetical protein